MESQARIGIFLCNCGRQLAANIDFQALADCARNLSGVAFVEVSDFLCQPESMKNMGERAKAEAVNRVIIAACSPRLYEKAFAASAEAAGLNPETVSICNIREQCAWLHSDRTTATDAAKRALSATTARARLTVPLEKEQKELNKRVLIIGGGAAGMQSAIEIVNFGYDVTLVEKSAELGGLTSNLSSFHQIPTAPKDFIDVTVEDIGRNEKIEILKNSTVYFIRGTIGDFDVRLETSAGRISRKCGAVVIATGADLFFNTALYGVNLNERFVSQSGLEQLLMDKNKAVSVLAPDAEGKRKRVFFILGMDAEDNAELATAIMLKQGLKLRREFDCEVYVAARNVKVAAPELEKMYAEARENGIVFFKFSDSSSLHLSEEGKARVRVTDQLLSDKAGNDYEIDFFCDLVVLEEMYRPAAPHADLLHMLGARPGPRGFSQENNPHLSPIFTTKPGVFVVGSARGPMMIPQVIADAGAAAAEIHFALGGGRIFVQKDRLRVDTRKCVLCLNCKRVCPYDAITYGLAATINAASCQACGACAAVCPNMAITYSNDSNEMYEAELENVI